MISYIQPPSITPFSAKVIFPALTITKDPFTGIFKSSKSCLVPKLAWTVCPRIKTLDSSEHYGIRTMTESATKYFTDQTQERKKKAKA